jgi:hypothetical protein
LDITSIAEQAPAGRFKAEAPELQAHGHAGSAPEVDRIAKNVSLPAMIRSPIETDIRIMFVYTYDYFCQGVVSRCLKAGPPWSFEQAKAEVHDEGKSWDSVAKFVGLGEASPQ